MIKSEITKYAIVRNKTVIGTVIFQMQQKGRKYVKFILHI